MDGNSGSWLGGAVNHSALPTLAEGVIGEDDGGHGFDHGNGPREDTGVVAPSRLEFGVCSRGRDGLLGAKDRGGGFEGDPEKNRFAVADSALNAAASVGRSANAARFHKKGVVVFAPSETRPRESAADFKAFGCGQTHHGFGEIGFEFIENGFTESWRNVPDHALD